jgi:polar amino acid transport system substrate-binding protein
MDRKNADEPSSEVLLTPVSRRSILLLGAATVVSLGLPSRTRARGWALTITYYDDFAPYSFLKADRTATGIYVDCMNEVLGRRAGMTLKHLAMPWARAQQEVKDANADGFCTSPSDARRAYVNFSREVMLQQNRVVVFAKDNPKADRIRKISKEDDIKQFSIGTYYGDARINTLFKDLNVDLAPDIKQSYMKVASGRVDIAVSDSAIWKYQARALGIRDKLDSVFLSDAPATYFGIRKNHEAAADILEIFDKGIAAARADGTVERIIAAYG